MMWIFILRNDDSLVIVTINVNIETSPLHSLSILNSRLLNQANLLILRHLLYLQIKNLSIATFVTLNGAFTA